jgi:hypothetical protein
MFIEAKSRTPNIGSQPRSGGSVPESGLTTEKTFEELVAAGGCTEVASGESKELPPQRCLRLAEAEAALPGSTLLCPTRVAHLQDHGATNVNTPFLRTYRSMDL